MMDKRYVVGVDVGTSTVKAVFVDTKENKIATTQLTEVFPVKCEKKEYIEYDAADWQRCVREVLERGFAAAGINPEEVAGVCFDDPAVMAFLVKEDGTPVYNPVHYNDMRHLETMDQLEALVGELCVERNANYITMYNGLAKQYWWKEKQPELYARTDYFTTATSWIAHQLTGKWVMNMQTAGFYGQYNAHTRRWDEEIMAKAGLDPRKFPPLVEGCSLVGCVTARAAGEWGLAEGTKVFAGLDDATPVALTCGAINEGDCYISAGSGANVAIISEKVMSHPTAMSYPHCVPGYNMAIAVLTCTGLSYKWVRNALGAFECAQAALTGEDAYDILNREAASAPAGSNGVIFLPYLDGDFTPNNDPNARGCFIGLNTTTTKGDMVRAVLEGVAFTFVSSLKMIRELGGDPKSLAIAGGVARSPLWLQIIADATGMPISLPAETEGGPLGSALVAGVGCGLFKDFRDAVDRVVVIERDKYVPDPETSKRYAELFAIYDRLYGQLKPTFGALAEYRDRYVKIR